MSESRRETERWKEREPQSSDKKKVKGRTGRNGFSSLYYRGLSPYFHSDPHIDRHTIHPAHYPPPMLLSLSPLYYTHVQSVRLSALQMFCPPVRGAITVHVSRSEKKKKMSDSIPRWSQKMGRSSTSERLLE